MKFAEFARTKNAKDKEPRKRNWNNIRNLAIGGTIGTGLGLVTGRKLLPKSLLMKQLDDSLRTRQKLKRYNNWDRRDMNILQDIINDGGTYKKDVYKNNYNNKQSSIKKRNIDLKNYRDEQRRLVKNFKNTRTGIGLTGLGIGSTIGYNINNIGSYLNNNIGSYLNNRKVKKQERLKQQELNNNSFKDPNSYINKYK